MTQQTKQIINVLQVVCIVEGLGMIYLDRPYLCGIFAGAFIVTLFLKDNAND